VYEYVNYSSVIPIRYNVPGNRLTSARAHNFNLKHTHKA